ncbi:hypothetical protein H4582DRAFT_90178 [Lactarius indigo]|nr:hypothetical protein H4582DRAFT_90178 [Lactarius indigo]
MSKVVSMNFLRLKSTPSRHCIGTKHNPDLRLVTCQRSLGKPILIHGQFEPETQATLILLSPYPLAPTNRDPRNISRAPPSTTMPPIQASIDSRPLFDNYDVAILTCAILSPLFILIFTSVIFLAWQSVARRRGIYGNRLHRAATTVLRSPRARKVRKETLFSPIVSALVVQSTLVASRPLRLGIVPENLWSSSAAHYLNESHGPEQPSRGRANIRQFSPASPTSNGDASHLNHTIWLLPTTLRGSRERRFFDLFAGLCQWAPSASARTSAESHRHAHCMVEPMKATGEPDPDGLEPDTVDIPGIFFSTDDPQFETGTLPIPLIILSLPSSEHLAEDPSPRVSLNEDLLSPDGTFRSSGHSAQVASRTYDISDATRLALASRLRHRQKRAISFPSPDVLTSPGVVRWPRWL